MTSLRLLLGTAGLLAAVQAAASTPDPSHSSIPAFIEVVGTQGGVPDEAGRFTIVVRDVANNPIVNANVIVDFTECTDAALCNTPVPGQTISCGAKAVNGFTDGAGRVSFLVVGAGKNHGGGAGPGIGCANVLVNFYSVARPTVNILDQDGAVGPRGLEVTDLSAWLADYGTGFYFGRSDYDHNHLLGVADLSLFLRMLGTGSSSEGCTTTYCP